MDENTRRQITWVLMLGAILCVIMVASYRKSELDRLAKTIGTGTVEQRMDAVRTLVEKQKLMEALEDKPRWVQDKAVQAVALIGADDAMYEMLTAHDMLDGAAQGRDQAVLTRLGQRTVEVCIEGIQDKDGPTRGAAKAPLINVGKAIEADTAATENPVIDACMSIADAWDQYVRDNVRDIMAGIASPRATDRLIAVMQQTEPTKKSLPDGTIRDQTTQEFMRAKGTAEAALTTMKVPAVEPIIAKLLTFKSPEVRGAACRVLGTIGNQTNKTAPNIPPDKAVVMVKPLLDRLNGDDQWAVRRRAASALGFLVDVAKENGCVPQLIQHLGDTEPVKAASAEALGRIGDVTAAEPLVTTLMTNRKGATSELRIALTALGPDAIAQTTRALTSSETEVRLNATQAIAEIGGPSAVVPLGGMLTDASQDVRRVSAAALRDIADERVLPQLASALGDQDWQVYHAARDALANVGAPAVPVLLLAMGNPNPRVSNMASEAVVRIGEPALPLLQAALSTVAVEAHWAAIAMGGIGAASVPYAESVLADTAKPVAARSMAALALGRTGAKDAVPALIDALAKQESPVKLEAISSLDDLADDRATAPLVECLNNPDVQVRDKAMDVLANWRIGKVQEELAKVMQTGDENAKRRATIIQAELTSVVTSQILEATATLTSEEHAKVKVDNARLTAAAVDGAEAANVRSRSIRALGYTGDQSSLKSLTSLLQPGNAFAGPAARAIARIGDRLAVVAKAGEAAALGEAGKTLVELMLATKDDGLRAQCAAALELLGEQPVRVLIDRFATADAQLKPWLAAALGIIGKPATDPVLETRGSTKDVQLKEWMTASLVLIGDAQALDLIQHLSEEDQPKPEKVDAAMVVFEKVRAAASSADQV